MVHAHRVWTVTWPVVGPGQVTGEHVLGTLVPLATDQRHRGEVRFAGRDERVMQCVGFGTRRRLLRALAVLEAFERIVQRDNAWVEAIASQAHAIRIMQRLAWRRRRSTRVPRFSST